MKLKLVILPRAERDVEAIFCYIEELRVRGKGQLPLTHDELELDRETHLIRDASIPSGEAGSGRQQNDCWAVPDRAKS